MALMLLMYMTSRRARTHSTHTHSHTHACSIPWHYRSCAFTPTNKNAHLFNTMDWHLNSLHTAYVKLAVRVKCTRKTHSRRPNYWVCARPAHTHAAGYALEQFMCLCMMLGVCVCVPGHGQNSLGHYLCAYMPRLSGYGTYAACAKHYKLCACVAGHTHEASLRGWSVCIINAYTRKLVNMHTSMQACMVSR